MTRSAAGDVHRVYGRASADEGRMLDEDRLALQIRKRDANPHFKGGGRGAARALLDGAAAKRGGKRTSKKK